MLRSCPGGRALLPPRHCQARQGHVGLRHSDKNMVSPDLKSLVNFLWDVLLTSRSTARFRAKTSAMCGFQAL